MTSIVQIRDCRGEDIPAISALYFNTVHNVNSRDYTPDQINAWAPEVYPESFWKERFAIYQVFVAQCKQDIVGFTELGKTGHIECFYVHHQWQGHGVGSKLMAHIEAEADRQNISRLSADVSVTARPFFERKGFTVVKAQQKKYRGQIFQQYRMEKGLTSVKANG